MMKLSKESCQMRRNVCIENSGFDIKKLMQSVKRTAKRQNGKIMETIPKFGNQLKDVCFLLFCIMNKIPKKYI